VAVRAQSAGASHRIRRQRRPDPRVIQTRQLVLEATFTLISESGFAGATVERIAERSGVARSSIYRHWPAPIPALHMEALAPLRRRPEDIPLSGDLRQDLLSYLRHVSDRLNEPDYAAVTLALLAVANNDPTYAEAHRELLATRTKILNRILADAVNAKALCQCTDVAFEARMLLAPLTHVRLVEHMAVDDGLAARLVDDLLERRHPNGPLCRCPTARGHPHVNRKDPDRGT
jgi:AcrR family transcriptional regulator